MNGETRIDIAQLKHNLGVYRARLDILPEGERAAYQERINKMEADILRFEIQLAERDVAFIIAPEANF
jgi:hypothetical protein